MPIPVINVNTQFPFFDNVAMFNKILNNVPGARDMSWQYDTSPCIMSPGAEIWIEHISIDRREYRNSKTFTIHQIDELDKETGLIVETDSVDEAICTAKSFRPQIRQLYIILK